jgi:hypothetical protein
MSDIAIRVEGLSERYKIGPREPYKARRDVMTDAFTSPFRRLGSSFQRSNVQTCQRSTFNSPFEIETGARHSPLGTPFPRFSVSRFHRLGSGHSVSPLPRFSVSPWSICNLQFAICNEMLPCSRAQQCSPAASPLPSAVCLLVFHISQFAIRNSQWVMPASPFIGATYPRVASALLYPVTNRRRALLERTLRAIRYMLYPIASPTVRIPKRTPAAFREEARRQRTLPVSQRA